MTKRIWMLCVVCVLVFSVSGCKQQDAQLRDGYYTAEMSAYSHGWKEFLTMDVSDGQIVAVEFNAKNPSGFIKAWDLAYMRNMNGISGTYPNRYTRTYAADLIQNQGEKEVDIVSGASTSGENFRKMAVLLLEKAKSGDTTPSVVDEAN